jgi:hypothetical protein
VDDTRVEVRGGGGPGSGSSFDNEGNRNGAGLTACDHIVNSSGTVRSGPGIPVLREAFIGQRMAKAEQVMGIGW